MAILKKQAYYNYNFFRDFLFLSSECGLKGKFFWGESKPKHIFCACYKNFLAHIAV